MRSSVPLRMPLAAVPIALACLALLDVAVARQAGGPAGVLRRIAVEPEGRLLRIDLKSAAPIPSFTLSRQGPPEKRDLVVHLPGFSSEVALPVDTGPYLLPIAIERDEGGGLGLKVVLGDVGDALVKVAQDPGGLSVVVIPPEKRSDAEAAYRIGPDDVLQVDVFGHEDLNKTLKVSPRGTINVPLIGHVHAQGRSVDDVAEEIRERLAKDFIQDPHVTVSVWEYLSQWVNVIGEVARPGRYYLTGRTTLVDALSQAGGLAPGAGDEILVTRRPEAVDPSAAGEVFRVSVQALFTSEDGKLDIRLRPGDVVNVQAARAASRP